MDRKSIIFLLVVGLMVVAQAQDAVVAPLFQSEKPLPINLAFSIKAVKKITNDSIYTPSFLIYQADNKSDTLPIGLRARGKFRRNNCSYPPIKIRLKKHDSEGSLFSGSKSLKLVLPCETGKRYNDLIVKEYLCYQLYEAISPYIFNTRLVNLSLTDLSPKPPKSFELNGILIEDESLIAKRFNAKVMDELKIHPLQLHDTTAVFLAFFEYMIANTDWSSFAQHNIKVLFMDGKYIPLAYDFDMAGLVNAPYATVNETLEIQSVRERLYRGFCVKEGVMQYVRAEYLEREPEIMAVVDKFQNDLEPQEVKGIKKYLGEFFATLKDERAFKANIISKCRTN